MSLSVCVYLLVSSFEWMDLFLSLWSRSLLSVWLVNLNDFSIKQNTDKKKLFNDCQENAF